jgi:hypothetical protein
VRVCSLYGAGFWYIPGTDTCIQIGGYLRADTTFNGSAHGLPAYSGDLGQRNRYFDNLFSRSRLALAVDTRTATEYGVVRTFGQADFQFNNFGTSNPTGFGAASIPSGLSGTALDGVGGGYVAIEFLFLQFAGLTFGKSASAYSTPWHGYPGNLSSFLLGGNDTVTGVNNIQYTAQFGNGVSASIGLDDPSVYNRVSVLNLGVAGSATAAGAFAYGGTHAPDVVGNVRVDQAWGLFQISAAAHEVDASYNILGAGGAPTALSEISGQPDTKWGGAVMAALQVKNLPTGAGDDIKIDVSYAKGDTKEVISTAGASPSFAMFGGSTRGYQSIGFGQTSDAVYAPVGLALGGTGAASTAASPGGTGDIKLVDAYGIRGAFNHNWDPYWSSSLFGSAAAVRYHGTAGIGTAFGDLTSAKGQWCASYKHLVQIHHQTMQAVGATLCHSRQLEDANDVDLIRGFGRAGCDHRRESHIGGLAFWRRAGLRGADHRHRVTGHVCHQLRQVRRSNASVGDHVSAVDQRCYRNGCDSGGPAFGLQVGRRLVRLAGPLSGRLESAHAHLDAVVGGQTFGHERRQQDVALTEVLDNL